MQDLVTASDIAKTLGILAAGLGIMFAGFHIVLDEVSKRLSAGIKRKELRK